MTAKRKIPEKGESLQTDKIIETLIADLDSKDGLLRKKARKKLVSFGPIAVDSLSTLVDTTKNNQRREAFKALTEIAAPESAPIFVKGLEDHNPDIQWLAAEGLIATGREGLKVLLSALAQDPESVFLRKGAHHVIKHVSRTMRLSVLDELIEILNDINAQSALPAIVRKALAELEHHKH